MTTEIISRYQRLLVCPSNCELVLFDKPFFLDSTSIHQVKNSHCNTPCLHIELLNSNNEAVSRTLEAGCDSSENKDLVRVNLDGSLIGMEKSHFLISLELRNMKLDVAPSWRPISSSYPLGKIKSFDNFNHSNICFVLV